VLGRVEKTVKERVDPSNPWAIQTLTLHNVEGLTG